MLATTVEAPLDDEVAAGDAPVPVALLVVPAERVVRADVLPALVMTEDEAVDVEDTI